MAPLAILLAIWLQLGTSEKGFTGLHASKKLSVTHSKRDNADKEGKMEIRSTIV